jgi:DNA (cytosine-5)-methyltransferase 1
LEDNEYSVTHKVVGCEEYGIPQHRSRLVLLASKFGDVSLISPEKFGKSKLTVKNAIGDLPPLEAGASDPDDPLHCSSALSDLNKRRIQVSKPGGTWRDWPKELVADCHKKKSGRSYPSVYGRMVWDDSSPTITTEFFGFGNGRFGHPEQNRALSLREGAILQSFPPEYKFVAPGTPVSIKANGRLIGNAVPVTLGEVIGVSLYNHVSSIPSSRIKSFIDARSQ